jgi:predicted DNA-binding transcriptional regulator AlpA
MYIVSCQIGVKQMKDSTPTDLISTTEAQHLLGISRPTMARLLKDQVIRHFPNPIDRRVKLVSKAEVEALKPKRAEAA